MNGKYECEKWKILLPPHPNFLIGVLVRVSNCISASNIQTRHSTSPTCHNFTLSSHYISRLFMVTTVMTLSWRFVSAFARSNEHQRVSQNMIRKRSRRKINQQIRCAEKPRPVICCMVAANQKNWQRCTGSIRQSLHESFFVISCTFSEANSLTLTT